MTIPTALLIAQALLSRWFLFYEVPGASLKDHIPNLSNEIEILVPTRSTPIVGLPAALEVYRNILANERPEVRNAHHINSLEVVEATDDVIRARADVTYRQTTHGTITLAANLVYDLEFAREGDRFRIRKLYARRTGEAPAPAADWSVNAVAGENLIGALQAERAVAVSGFADTSIRNQIEAFAGYWYWFFDVRPEGNLIQNHITPDAQIVMTRSFANRQEFLDWYAGMRSLPMLNAHRVLNVDLRSVSETEVTADIYLFWQNQREGQELSSQFMRNTMRLRRASAGEPWQLVGYEPSVLPR